MKDEKTLSKAARSYIREMLSTELRSRENMMLDAICHKFPSMPTRIEQYQEVFEVLEAWDEWEEELED